jgi:hypothetical protein
MLDAEIFLVEAVFEEASKTPRNARTVAGVNTM